MRSRSNQGRLISGMFYEKSSSDENKLGDITRNVKQILEDDYSSDAELLDTAEAYQTKLGKEASAAEYGFDPVESLRHPDHNLFRFIASQPIPIQRALLDTRGRTRRQADTQTNCTWTVETESNLYLLMTFHNLSAPFTVDCEGAYIEVVRDSYESRWCGNRVTQGGSRPHVIFAKKQVRITVFDDGGDWKTLPTGFNADAEVIDLFDAREYSSLRKSSAYNNIRMLNG